MSLYYKIYAIKNKKLSISDEEYKKFIQNDLIYIIGACSAKGQDEIKENYQRYLEDNQTSLRDTLCLLRFLKSNNLLDFYCKEDCIGEVTCKTLKDNLSNQDILGSYKSELISLGIKEKNNSNLTILERLDLDNSLEERKHRLNNLATKFSESLQLSQKENAYNNFVTDLNNGLYKILKEALENYNGIKFILKYNPQNIDFNLIQEFCDKYLIDIKKIEINENTNKDYLPNIQSIQDIRNLFVCFFLELQKIEHFSKSKNELWEEYKNFIINNQEWLRSKNSR